MGPIEVDTVRIEVETQPFEWLHRHGRRSSHSHRLLPDEPRGIDSDEEPHHWHEGDDRIAVYWAWAAREADR